MDYSLEQAGQGGAAAGRPRAETHYRALFMATEQAFCVIERVVEPGQPSDYRYVAVNPAFARHSGLPDVIGRTLRQVVPGVEARIVAVFDDALASGQPRHFEERVAELDAWIAAEVIPDQQPGCLAVLFSNVTARKRHEANLAFLAVVSEALAQLTNGNINDTLNALGEKLAAHLGLAGCALAELAEGAQLGVVRHGWHRADLPDLRGIYRLSELVAPEVLRRCQAGEAVVVCDVVADPLTDGAPYAALRIGSWVSVPLVRGGEWCLLLMAYRAEPHDWREDEIELLREVTARMWARLERARAEAALAASEERFRAVANLVPDLLWSSTPDSETTWYNQRWREYTGQTLAEAAGYGWADVVHADDRVESSRRYWAAVADGQSLYQDHRIRSAAGEYRWFQVQAQALRNEHGEVITWFGAATDIHARKQREQHQEFLLQLSDALRAETGVAAVGNRVVQLLARQLRADRVYLVALRADDDTVVVTHETRRADLPPLQGAYRSADFPAAMKEIFERAISYDDVRTDARLTELDRRSFAGLGAVGFLAAPIRRGSEALMWAAGAVSTQPRAWTTAEVALFEEAMERIWAALSRARVEADLRRSELEFRSLVAATSDVVYKMSADWSQMHQLLGKSFLADMPQASDSWLTHYIPEADQELVQAAIEAAIDARAPFELEHRVVQADGQVGWVYSRAMPLLDAQGGVAEWLGTAQDITLRKQAETQLHDFNAALERQVAERTQALRDSRDLLHGIAKAQSAYVNAFKAIRDESGHIVDLEFVFVNSITTRVDGGRPLVGRRYLEAFPEAESSGLLDTFRRIIETGVGEDQETFYDDGQLTGWFRNNATRLGDGLLAIGEDITARKQAEQERLRALHLLEQAEQVGNLGSWDYELATGRLRWSAGMYRLFHLTAADPVGPDCYRQAVVPDDQAIAERLIGHLTAGTAAFEETLRLHLGGQVKTVRVRGVALPGEPGRVLGVDLDISDVRRLEAENLALRLDQQKALLMAMLQAQEAERNRLAETLHNGLGQVLYAIKLQLSQLDGPALHALPELNGVRQHLDHLLSEAIGQARTLAHELMPAALSEHGLGHALRDICRGMSTPHLRFSCQVWEGEQVLTPALQTTLYRLAQELAHNIAKHSGASQATLEFELLPGWVILRAEDNGRGFDSTATPWGLGLRLLHDAVDLLDGVMQLDSSPEYGTHVRLRIPIN